MAKKHVIVPHQIKFMTQKQELVTINPGIQMMDEEVLNHPHVARQGVKEYDPEAEVRKLREEAEAAAAKVKAAEEAVKKQSKENKQDK